MTRAEAVEYFMVHAISCAYGEGFGENPLDLAAPNSVRDGYALLVRHYSDCALYLLGLPRSYQPEFS